MDAPPVYQEVSYYDHVKQRHADKGCLYAWSVYLINFFLLYYCIYLFFTEIAMDMDIISFLQFRKPSQILTLTRISTCKYVACNSLQTFDVQFVRGVLLFLLLRDMRVLFGYHLLQVFLKSSWSTDSILS